MDLIILNDIDIIELINNLVVSIELKLGIFVVVCVYS